MKEEESRGPNDQSRMWGCNGMDDCRCLAWVLEDIVEPLTETRIGCSSKFGDCPCWGRVSLIDCYGSRVIRLFKEVFRWKTCLGKKA